MIQTIDTDIQTQISGKHLPNDGSIIGGNMPTGYDYGVGAPGDAKLLVVHLQGQPYATGELYANRTIQQNTGHVRLDYQLAMRPDALEYGSLFECDLKLTPDGVTMFNASHQFLKVDGVWRHQVSSDAGWIDTGLTTPAPASDVFVAHSMELDFTSADAPTMSLKLEGVAIPTKMNVTKLETPWKPGAYWQTQHTLGPNAGSYTCGIKGVTLTWW